MKCRLCGLDEDHEAHQIKAHFFDEEPVVTHHAFEPDPPWSVSVYVCDDGDDQLVAGPRKVYPRVSTTVPGLEFPVVTFLSKARIEGPMEVRMAFQGRVMGRASIGDLRLRPGETLEVRSLLLELLEPVLESA